MNRPGRQPETGANNGNEEHDRSISIGLPERGADMNTSSPGEPKKVRVGIYLRFATAEERTKREAQAVTVGSNRRTTEMLSRERGHQRQRNQARSL